MERCSAKKTRNLKFLTFQNVALQALGIDIHASKREKLFKSYSKFIFIISCLIYVEYSFLNSVVYNGVTNLTKAGGSLSLLSQSALVAIKVSIFLLKSNGFLKLISNIISLAQNANSLEKEKWLSENSRGELIVKIFFYNCTAATICSGLFPIILMAYDYKQNHRFTPKLPFGSRFPGSKDSIFLFIVNYVLSLICVYGLLNMTVAIDTLYGWFIHTISAHFRILRCKIEKLASDLQDSNYVNFSQDISSIANYHNQILKFVHDLNDIFGEILFGQVMLNVLQLCLVVYNFKNDDDMSNLPFNGMVVVCMIMQITIYCFGGEKIKDESLMLCSDFYLIPPWHKMSPKQKKSFILPLMRAQRLCVLRGIFFDADRELMVFIFKTAVSFNALLAEAKE